MFSRALSAFVSALLLLSSLSAVAQADEVPLTIDGVINCAHPDNAITTTCRGENPPEPAPTAPVTTEPAPVGTTITYSGDVAIDCSLDANKENNICLPMTRPDGSINCQQADNAITTTCWNRFQELSNAGADLSEEVDCSQDRFKGYPVCTGVKPQAVIDFEQSKTVDLATVITPTTPEAGNLSESSTTLIEESTEPTSQEVQEAQTNERVEGQISIRNRTAKATVLNLSVNTPGVIVRVVASKKGTQAISREVTVEDGGEFRLRLPKNLKGHTLRLIVDGEELDRVTV